VDVDSLLIQVVCAGRQVDDVVVVKVPVFCSRGKANRLTSLLSHLVWKQYGRRTINGLTTQGPRISLSWQLLLFPFQRRERQAIQICRDIRAGLIEEGVYPCGTGQLVEVTIVCDAQTGL